MASPDSLILGSRRITARTVSGPYARLFRDLCRAVSYSRWAVHRVVAPEHVPIIAAEVGAPVRADLRRCLVPLQGD